MKKEEKGGGKNFKLSHGFHIHCAATLWLWRTRSLHPDKQAWLLKVAAAEGSAVLGAVLGVGPMRGAPKKSG